MPQLTIGDQTVTVGDNFLKLSPDQQNATVEEISRSLGRQNPGGGQKAEGMSWGDVAQGAAKNIVPSAVQFGKDVVQPILHPINTAIGVKNIGQGVLEKAGVISGNEHEQYADAVGKLFKDKYGGMENFKRTLATDPVGVVADLSMLLTGGETALARAPGALGKVGEIAGETARLPGTIARGIEKGASEVIGGLGTHTGGESLRLAARAGYEGGDAAKAFRENLRGQAPMEDVVNDARSALGQIRKERGDAYRSGMVGIGSDPTILPFNTIDRAVQTASAVKRYKGQSLSPSTTAVSDRIAEAVDGWRNLDPQEFHTAEGLDALKQKIGDIRDSTQERTPERFAADRVYQAIKKTITDQAPQYAKVMKGYESASQELKEIEKTLSLNPNATIDTSLRKLQSVLRDNVNTSYGQRRVLADYLVNAGAPHLMERLAGQALKPWTARGLGKLGMELAATIGGGGAIAGATGAGAAAVATLPFMSPRLMGEAAYFAGRAASPLGAALESAPVRAMRPAVQPLRQAGRIAPEGTPEGYAIKTFSAAFPKEADALDAAVSAVGGEKILSPLAKIGQASAAFRGAPNPRTMTQLSLASRNLATNLRDVGINVSQEDIMKAFSGEGGRDVYVNPRGGSQ